MRNMLTRFLGLLLLLCSSAQVFATETHPRLWLTSSDVTRLRTWAVPSNPLYANALQPLVARAKAEMDNGDVPRRDCGSTEYESYPAEMYAELFAFMSLIENDVARRIEYANRARALLMTIINVSLAGPASEANYVCPENQSIGYPPYRSPRFFTEDSNRARWHGEALPLVVDWIYPFLTASEKQSIRTVFLRWSQEIVERGYHRPSPIGLVNSPTLLQDNDQVRWSGNNYFTAHMRNLGMMALALDAADDPNNQLRNYLGNATGAWLYIFDHLSRGEAKGGLLPEGYEYSPQTASYVVQFLLALKTAGADNCGSHCQIMSNPFWDDFLTSFYHTLSPAPINDPDSGQLYQPAWYGDGENYRSSDFISVFGALGWYDYLVGNQTRLQSLRWAQTHMVPGGAASFIRRAANPDDFRQSILYFLLYEPGAASATDPRNNLSLNYHATGMNMLLARTSWDTTASWFSYILPWNLIDHQQANANNFEWYRKGEWLTKARTGYPDIAEGIASSEFRNAIALQNDQPNRDANDWRTDLWQRGSQWNLVASGNPSLLASSMQSAYTYALGDATNLYNSSSEGVTDILHASRSIMWLKPDAVVVFDRAQSRTANRFKRWWLQLANPATINGKRATASTALGQQLQIDSLLPSNATLTAVNTNTQHIENTAARGEPMKVRLRIDAPDNPSEVRFLQVLQAADAGASMPTPSLVQNAEQTWSGAQLGSVVVMFPHSVTASFNGLSYSSTASSHYITGLVANAGYAVSQNGNTLTLSAGGNFQADSGGVLMYSSIGSGGTPAEAPSVLRAVPLNGGIDIYFSAPTNTGSSAISSYTATCSATGQSTLTASSPSSPIRVAQLSSGVEYSCSVLAVNGAGNGAASASLKLQAQNSLGNIPMVLAGNRANYTIAAAANGFTVTDNVGGGGSFSAGGLGNPVQRLQFADTTIALDIDGNPGKVYRLYQAAFDRVPDLGGVGFHLVTIEKYGLSLEQVSKNFIDSREFSDRYGNLDHTQFVTQLYANVLHRAPDAGGLAFWVNILQSGAGDRYGVLVGFSESAENKGAVAAAIANGVEYTPYLN